jgi:hypothetical protein
MKGKERTVQSLMNHEPHIGRIIINNNNNNKAGRRNSRQRLLGIFPSQRLECACVYVYDTKGVGERSAWRGVAKEEGGTSLKTPRSPSAGT